VRKIASRPPILLLMLLLAATACNLLTRPDPGGTHLPPPVSTAPATTAHFEGATITTYPISGQTAAELRAQMDLYGPTVDGYKGDAAATWYISWNWPGYGTETCDLSQASTSLATTVILPEWKGATGASAKLRQQWSTYLDHLAAHEQGHLDLVAKYYPQVRPAILGATCASAEAAAQTILEQLRAADRTYDTETMHGAAQGAVFP
jgi:predicted secreted Zn-dependent protease